MNKEEFLAELKSGLAGFPQEEVSGRLAFYREAIDDRMEEGIDEYQAVESLGPVNDIVQQTLEDIPLKKLVRERIRPKRERETWESLLIVLGFPVWFPLLVASFAVVLAVFVVLWALLASLWVIESALIVSSIAVIAFAVYYLIQGGAWQGVALIGAGLFIAGLAIFLFFGCVGASKCCAKLTKKIAIGIKRLFVRKENAQ